MTRAADERPATYYSSAESKRSISLFFTPTSTIDFGSHARETKRKVNEKEKTNGRKKNEKKERRGEVVKKEKEGKCRKNGASVESGGVNYLSRTIQHMWHSRTTAASSEPRLQHRVLCRAVADGSATAAIASRGLLYSRCGRPRFTVKTESARKRRWPRDTGTPRTCT